MSLADLAGVITFNRGYIGNVETGHKLPSRQFAEAAGDALGCRSDLVAAWGLADAEHREHKRTVRLLQRVAVESRALAVDPGDDCAAEAFDLETRRLAHSYTHTPPAPVLAEAARARGQVIRSLSEHRRPQDQSDLYLSAGYLSGVLAYAALDLGDPPGAVAHSEAAWRSADLAGHNGLRAWVRGTQSLITRFQSRFTDALEFARDGQRFATEGTGLVRLLCGEAQCLANLGDSAGANAALDRAQDAREHSGPDPIGGLFGFTLAKQHYYAGSSLIWLDRPADARRAQREATLAIRLFGAEPRGERSLNDEALAHVYLGTAHLRLGDLDAATESVEPVLTLPSERRISWISKRLNRLATLAQAQRFGHARAAVKLRDRIDQFQAETTT